MNNIVSLDFYREAKLGFQDHHGRTWIRARPHDTNVKLCTWNGPNGEKIVCRLKYPNEADGVSIEQTE